MLVDNIKLVIRAGGGGNGAATVNPFGGPDGGNGGNGGNIYMQGTTNINDLREFRYKKKITAQNGTNGARKNMYGRKAEDVTIKIPLGTRITELKTGEAIEIESTTPILMARGGRGGLGNNSLKPLANQRKKIAEQGEPGEEKEFYLELRMIAEIGLVGLPNAGKSSLLTVLTNATPAIGNYPFTTLEPTIGMFGTHAMADIPGLIEGASRGKGLGLGFLRHIEKTKILLHCMDVGNPEPMKSYTIIREELKKFDPAMLKKPEYILLTKTDLVEKQILDETIKIFSKLGKTVLTCSVYEPATTDALKASLEQILSVS